MQIILIGLLALGGVFSVYGIDDFILPEGIPTCKEFDENLNQCLKDVFQQMLPKLNNGLESLNIPPIDPFVINSTNYQYGNSAVRGRLAIRNAKVYGMSQAIINDVDFKINENGTTLSTEIYLPRVFIEGAYKADVKFNEIKMNPKGYFNVTMGNVKANMRMTGTFQDKNGNRFIYLDSFDIEPEVGEMKIYASGLFPDPALNAIVLDFVNEYWHDIYKIIIPETRTHWEPVMLNAANTFLLSVPFDKLVTKN